MSAKCSIATTELEGDLAQAQLGYSRSSLPHLLGIATESFSYQDWPA